MPTRVLLCDDAQAFRAYTRHVLMLMPGVEVVGEAIDGRDALRRMEALQPDVVLLDLQMPRMGGMEALPLLRRRFPHSRVVVFSGETHRAEDALELGAAAFVEKGGPVDDLMAAVLGPPQAASAAWPSARVKAPS